ncbi:RND family transporter [Mycobacterium sp. IS-1264]|uniref:MMPL/RND family transporter n=1 Tax=Mycobacterium sp. IS-1264 TaxID=1834158 RepID=UPI0009F912E2|nr:RND family transporter [Mycobacterium sp. IS-1264]
MFKPAAATNAAGASAPATGVFGGLGLLVVRAPWLIIAAWAAVVAVLAVAFPPLTKVVESKPLQPFPPQAMAAADQMAKDFGESAQNILVVVLTDNRGLQPVDEQTYAKLAATLRGDARDVSGVHDVVTTPALRPLMASADNKASYMAVSLRAPAGTPESTRAYQRIMEIAKRSTAGSTLTAELTGQGAMAGDLTIVSTRDMHMIETVTALLVLAILLVIYRRPVMVAVVLIVLGISVTSAQGAVSALAQAGLGVSSLTIALMTAMIFGAGTDYAVFLISRYHEYIRSGMNSDVAVQKALSSIGEVIAASAATVAVTFLGMVFTRLPAFTSIGPALAVSVGMAFVAAVTLLPAMLVLTGRRGWVKPRPPLTGRMWQRSAVQLVRRPKAHLLASVSVLIVLASCAAFLRPSFNDRLQLPQSSPSNVGYSTMAAHFSTSTLLPEYIYVRSPHDLRTSRALADLDQMAQRVSQLPDIAAVRGITRPTGQPLDQAKLSNEAGTVGSKLQDASTQISDRTSDLDALTNGADQLAASLAEVRDHVRAASGPMTRLAATVGQAQQQLGAAATVLDNVRQLANGSIATLTNSVAAAAAPMLGGSIPRPSVDAIQAAVQNLTGLLATTSNSLRAAGGSTAGMSQKIGAMQAAADQLADGSRRLAVGVRTLVEQTKKMGLGMSQAADLLLSMKRDATTPSMAGLYIPPQVITSDDFKNAAKMFISPDGHAVRYMVETKFDPFSTAAMNQVESVLDTARGAQPNTTLSDATISMVGMTPMYTTLRSYYNNDFRLIVIMTLLVVFVILVILLRALVAPLYLIASVVISYLSAVGLGVVFFQFVLHQAISWNVQATAFIVLVAVGADYNLLLITRIREESRFGIRSGIIRAVRSTGGVITSAGIIFAASMFGMLTGSLSTMVQTGFIIGMGLLIDTFVVRTVTVPALAALVGKANWWPARPAKVAKPAKAVPAATGPAPAALTCIHGDMPHALVASNIRRSAARRRRALAQQDARARRASIAGAGPLARRACAWGVEPARESPLSAGDAPTWRWRRIPAPGGPSCRSATRR